MSKCGNKKKCAYFFVLPLLILSVFLDAECGCTPFDGDPVCFLDGDANDTPRDTSEDSPCFFMTVVKLMLLGKLRSYITSFVPVTKSNRLLLKGWFGTGRPVSGDMTFPISPLKALCISSCKRLIPISSFRLVLISSPPAVDDFFVDLFG